MHERHTVDPLPGASYSLHKVDADGWPALLEGFRDASLMQTPSYAAARWPGTTLERLIVPRPDGTAAAAQVVIRKLPLVGGGLAYVHFGPMWQPQHSATDYANLESAILCLCAEYVDKRGMLLRVRPWPTLGHDGVTPIFEGLGFTRQVDVSPDRFLVNVALPERDLNRSLHGKWRYNLKRSYRHDLDIVSKETGAGLEPFMDLYREMVARKTFADNSAIAELPAIYADLPDALKPQIWLCYYRGEPIAGAVVSVLGNTAQYLFGASRDQALDVNAGYRLHWTIATALRERCRWYDLGGDSGSSGLRQFKSGMVGKLGQVAPLPGDFERCSNPRSLAAVRLAMWGRDVYLAARQAGGRWRTRAAGRSTA